MVSFPRTGSTFAGAASNPSSRATSLACSGLSPPTTISMIFW
ncbi:hypothetical protein Save01_03293 [Streptomyces avermitilis]